MKINALENLILSQLGGNQQTKPVTLTNSYPTPAVTQAQPQLEVRDPRGQQQSVMANPNQLTVQTVKQVNTRPVTTQPQNNTVTANQPATVTSQQSSAVIDTGTSTYALKIESVLKSLVAGRDFCQLPGIKNSVLLRSGLVKVLRSLNYRYSFKLIDKQLKEGILCYTIEVTIIDEDGVFVGSALGSANSAEKKFADKGLSSDNILSAIASTRALRSAVKDILVR